MKSRTGSLAAAFCAGLLCTGCPMPMDSANGQNGNGDGLQSQLADLQSKLNSVESQLRQRVYGTGTAGARTVTSDIRLDGPDANLQYTDFIVEEGVTLTVQSGTVIRCTGRFINRGTIVLQSGTRGADRAGVATSTQLESLRPAAMGIGKLAAASGEVGGPSAERLGGAGGEGLSEFEARILLMPQTQAGGSGGAALASGGDGGGAMTVIAAGEIRNEGVIRADGVDAIDGGGGGGAGVLIFASGERVVNAAGASIAAEGGLGGDSTSNSGPGGGGGGGIVHLIAPDMDNDGDVSVAGGEPGTAGPAGSITGSPRSGGGGGGASAGAGGQGGAAGEGAEATPEEASPGAAGRFLTTTMDPGTLF